MGLKSVQAVTPSRSRLRMTGGRFGRWFSAIVLIPIVLMPPPAGYAQSRITRVQPGDAQLVTWLRELRPLQKVHYSWPIPDRYLHALDGLLFEYVRIAHAVSLRAETCTRQQIDAAVSVCNRVNKANPEVPATIALNYSPWHRQFDKDLPPTDTGPTHANELRQMRERFAFVSERVAAANRLENAAITVSAILLDSERFVIRQADSAWNEAITAKHRAVYELARRYFPHARIEWYNRGGVHPAASATGWGQSRDLTLSEPGDGFACSLYRVPEIQTTRETLRRTVELADAAGVEEITTWVALGSGNRRTPTSMTEWSFDWRYDLSYSWQLGAEINNPWYSRPEQRGRFAPWQRVKVVVFYPEPFGRSPLWGSHFVAYVRGAHGIKVLPGEEPAPQAAAPPSGRP